MFSLKQANFEKSSSRLSTENQLRPVRRLMSEMQSAACRPQVECTGQAGDCLSFEGPGIAGMAHAMNSGAFAPDIRKPRLHTPMTETVRGIGET